ncbi:lipopolysaccharide biosynthesis protein [Thiolapillus sp.]
MVKRQIPRIVNMGLRALAVGSKFLLLFGLAKMLPPSEVGQYGLFAAAIGFSVLVIGGDFYTYSQRELLSTEQKRWSFILQHQVIASLLLYLVLLPAQLLWFSFNLLPGTLIFWFFSILVTEHFAQEINRLLIAMRRPLVASWVLFIRMGLWIWIILPIMWFHPEYQALEFVYLSWLIGTSLAFFTGALVIWKETRPWKWWALDMAWIRKGFNVGMVFLVATMCFKALLTLDRYVVEHLAGKDFLGVYVLYIGMVMAVTSFMDSAVFSFLYPKLVRAFRQSQYPEYRRILREMVWSVFGFGLALGAGVIIIAPLILEWIGKSLYLEHLSLLWLLLAMSLIYNAGMIPHYGLYAIGDDRGIMIAHISSLPVFVLATAVFSTTLPLHATALGLLCAFSWMGLYKYWRYRNSEKPSLTTAATS